MDLVTIGVLREHCKADAAEDAQLTVYGDAAEAAVRAYVNRNIYVDQTALNAARAGVAATMTTAHAAYNTAIDDAGELEEELDALFAAQAANSDLMRAQADAQMILDGMVTNKSIVAAVLLTAAHFYRNREAVVTGQSASAQEVPLSARWLLDPWRAIGPL